MGRMHESEEVGERADWLFKSAPKATYRARGNSEKPRPEVARNRLGVYEPALRASGRSSLGVTPPAAPRMFWPVQGTYGNCDSVASGAPQKPPLRAHGARPFFSTGRGTLVKRINIIGCGRLGKTLGKLFSRGGVFEIAGVVNRTRRSAEDAVRFLGAGSVIDRTEELPSADVVLLGVPDDAIAGTAHKLAATGIVRPGDVAFHASGSFPSTLLSPLSERGAFVASVHPVQSFARPAESVESFPGTWCGVEGDAAALAVLTPAVEAVGGRPFPVETEGKLFYHAAAVIACNYLSALLEAGLRAYEKAGVDRERAVEIVGPLVRQTLENVLEVGPAAALTGPIARGDADLVGAQAEALLEWDEDVGRVYASLGKVAVDLAREAGDERSEALGRIATMLESVSRARDE